MERCSDIQAKSLMVKYKSIIEAQKAEIIKHFGHLDLENTSIDAEIKDNIDTMTKKCDYIINEISNKCNTIGY